MSILDQYTGQTRPQKVETISDFPHVYRVTFHSTPTILTPLDYKNIHGEFLQELKRRRF